MQDTHSNEQTSTQEETETISETSLSTSQTSTTVSDSTSSSVFTEVATNSGCNSTAETQSHPDFDGMNICKQAVDKQACCQRFENPQACLESLGIIDLSNDTEGHYACECSSTPGFSSTLLLVFAFTILLTRKFYVKI